MPECCEECPIEALEGLFDAASIVEGLHEVDPRRAELLVQLQTERIKAQDAMLTYCCACCRKPSRR